MPNGSAEPSRRSSLRHIRRSAARSDVTMRVVFAGTPAVAVPALRAVLRSRHHVVAVLTRPDAPAGRGRSLRPSPVAQVAADAGIEVLKPARPRDPEFLGRLAEIGPDCAPVVAYGGLIPRAALDVPKHGWVNLHFSLLPAWRGAAPVQHAILAGDEITGACIFQIEEGLDTGPVYGLVTEQIRPTDTSGDLLARLAESGAGLHAGARSLDDLPGRAAQAAADPPQTADHPPPPGRGRGRPRRRARRDGQPRDPTRRGPAPGQAPDARGRLGARRPSRTGRAARPVNGGGGRGGHPRSSSRPPAVGAPPQG